VPNPHERAHNPFHQLKAAYAAAFLFSKISRTPTRVRLVTYDWIA
jgi:hypothetical protein